ncbi:MAG: LamG-like jellyroll fold domain-containing protein [Phycisphaerales bacterium]
MLRNAALLGVLLIAVLSIRASAGLIAYYPFSEGQGTATIDATGNGNNGTLSSGVAWVAGVKGGAVQFDTAGERIVIGAIDPSAGTNAMTLAAWIKWEGQNHTIAQQGIIGKRLGWSTTGDTIKWFWQTNPAGDLLFRADYNGGGTSFGWGNALLVPYANEWAHVAVTWKNGPTVQYIDGEQVSTGDVTFREAANATPVTIGCVDSTNTETFVGVIDEVRIYDMALTADGIVKAMTGDTASASAPQPAAGATDVRRDVVLSWTPGESAASHDVYLGTDFIAVDQASRTDDRGVLVSADQTATSCDLDELLEFSTVYYWRVDEVNAPPDSAIAKGPIWSFTVEPYAYPIPNVTAVASAQQPGSPASNTVNGSGLDELDQHGVDVKTMWVSPSPLPAWIRFTFDKEYKLHELWVWNANSELESLMNFGAKTVTIEYSTDGETWTALENVSEFAQGTGERTYTANNIIDLGEVMARYVKLTITATYGFTGITSLSEVRFYYTPAQAFEPDPADGATGVSIDATLNWRPGREITSHEVYFGADPNALSAQTVTDNRFTPAAMDFGTVYYWRVDEVGATGTYVGDLWSFTAEEFAPADDFESYDDDIDAGTTIWQTWIDGISGNTNGSQVGYDESPFAEQTIVHGGRQSMPITYDNDGTFREGTQFERTGVPFYSEVERVFDPVQNWTGNGATDVGLWVRGYPVIAAVAVAEAGGKMDLTGAGADIWDTSDEFTYAFKTLTGDGTLIARVVSNGTGSNTWAKGGVMIRDSLNGGSSHATMVMTGSAGNGASFQYRQATGGASSNVDSGSVLAPPYWVKIERFADTFTGSVSADGKTWTQMGQTTVAMANPVCIGLCVTSHAPGEDRTFQFDGIASTGAVTGAWQGAVIDSPLYNGPANMSLTIEDSAGKKATATSDTLVTAAEWTLWSIPMSDFAGVNFTRVKRIAIAIGDKNATTPGTSGIVFIDDLGFGRPAE